MPNYEQIEDNLITVNPFDAAPLSIYLGILSAQTVKSASNVMQIFAVDAGYCELREIDNEKWAHSRPSTCGGRNKQTE